MHYSEQELHEVKVFKDPVHRYVHVADQVIWDLIGTKEFQRLRRIKQLGTTYFTFHGAEHSRFQHSLGVYEIMRRMIDDVFKKKEGWRKEDRLLALCAALLHDVGHGPFSHSFEKVFECNHEEFSRRIILEDTEINVVLRMISDDFPQQVADIIAKTSDNKLVVSMISSQIDADRMDYLLRDAYYTGVSYGVFDLERLLRVLRPYENQVVIKQSGMHAVEHYILSRYQMYWQIYFHPVTRSAEVILTKILERAKELYRSSNYSFETKPTHFDSMFLNNTLSLKQYLRLDEAVLLYYFQMWEDEKDEILSDLCKRFNKRDLFKYIELDNGISEEDIQQLKEIFKEAGVNESYYLVEDSSHDTSYDIYLTNEGKPIPIHLLQQNGELVELSKKSAIVHAITDKTQTDSKLFYPKDILTNDLLSPQSLETLKSILNK